MERPELPLMADMEAIIQDIEDMENALSELRTRLAELPAQMAVQCQDEAERNKLAHYLYWFVSEMPPKAISEGLFGTPVGNLRCHIGTATTSTTCDRCQSSVSVTFKSRSDMQKAISEIKRLQKKGHVRYPEGYIMLCRPCQSDVFAERKEQYKQQDAVRRQRIYQLQTMPYYEYLQTPEWHGRRLHHVQSAGYRCQVCNASGVTLNVHHRTYERRGSEYYTDLITLCQPCHELFHREGRLAGY